MRYEFESESGCRIEVSYPMGTAPSVGEWIEYGGNRYRRVHSLPGVPITGSRPHVSWGLDPYSHPEHTTRTDGSGGIPKGLIAFTSETQRREFAKRTQDTATPVVLDA